VNDIDELLMDRKHHSDSDLKPLEFRSCHGIEEGNYNHDAWQLACKVKFNSSVAYACYGTDKICRPMP